MLIYERGTAPVPAETSKVILGSVNAQVVDENGILNLSGSGDGVNFDIVDGFGGGKVIEFKKDLVGVKLNIKSSYTPDAVRTLRLFRSTDVPDAVSDGQAVVAGNLVGMRQTADDPYLFSGDSNFGAIDVSVREYYWFSPNDETSFGLMELELTMTLKAAVATAYTNGRMVHLAGGGRYAEVVFNANGSIGSTTKKIELEYFPNSTVLIKDNVLNADAGKAAVEAQGKIIEAVRRGVSVLDLGSLI